MNKQQIITPVIAIALVLLVGAMIFSRNQSRDFLQRRAMEVGRELITHTNSPGVVHLGFGLKGRLEEMLEMPAGVSAFEFGDAPSPVGDGKASACLYLTNATGTCIGIRLRPDSESDKLHVVGYWTVR